MTKKIAKKLPLTPSIKISSEKKLRTKWGGEVWDHGWLAVPNLILERQKALCITPTELNVLLFLIHHSREKRTSFPSKKKISTSIGVSDRTIQRATSGLKEKGIIEIMPKHRSNGGISSNIYDLTPLVEKLKKML